MTSTLGELVEAARPIVTADPTAHGPIPRFNQAVAAALLDPDPAMAAQPAGDVDDEQPLDPVEATCWALETSRARPAAQRSYCIPADPSACPGDLRDASLTRRFERATAGTTTRINGSV